MSANDEAKKQEGPGQRADEKPAEPVKGPEAKPSKKEEDETITLKKEDYLKLQENFAAMTAEAEKWKNEYYLSLADTQNLRKSLQEDHREVIRYRAEGFLDGLIPALDSFYVALSVTPKSDEAKNYQQGFQYIYNQIQNALAEEGVSEILPKIGDGFDPTLMHAVDVEEGEKENAVAKVYSKGCKLHDRLIRPAMVRVYKKTIKKTEEKSAPGTDAAADKKDSEATKA
jgi:molecular chaperone GrpE